MAEIKICGITSLEDASVAAEAGADAVGFIFYPGSPRFVTPRKARGIIGRLGPGVVKVGVFVNQDPSEVKGITSYCGLDMIQLHGDESPEYCSVFPSELLIKALSGCDEEDPEPWVRYAVRAFLLDARDPSLYGGTGKRADWALAARLGRSRPLILSGGLNCANIREAMEIVSPAAVDINSGVEVAPGKKDHAKVREIIRLVRQMRGAGKNGVFVSREGGYHGQGDA